MNPVNHGKRWTDYMDAKLKRLFDSGLSIPDIADEMGRKVCGITSRLKFKRIAEVRWIRSRRVLEIYKLELHSVITADEMYPGRKKSKKSLKSE